MILYLILVSFCNFLFVLWNRLIFSLILIAFLWFVACALSFAQSLVVLIDFLDFLFAGFLDFISLLGLCFRAFDYLFEGKFCLFRFLIFIMVYAFFREIIMIVLFQLALFHFAVLFNFLNLFLMMNTLI